MSTLGYAILGLLATQPRTGYDLARLTTDRDRTLGVDAACPRALAVVSGALTGVSPDPAGEYESRLATYAMEEAAFLLEADAVDDPTSYVFDEYATLRYGIMRVRETIAWFDWLLDRLDRLHPTARLAADTSGAANQPD
jgi:hypothetical protein